MIGDNRLVAALGLTHRELARPLFHLWNLLLPQHETGQRQTMQRLRYHGKEVSVRWQGSRGWQDSLFHDEIQGTYEFEVWREMDAAEKSLSAPEATLSGLHAGPACPLNGPCCSGYASHANKPAGRIG